MRVWVPLPDWLVIGAVVAVSIASLTFIAIGLLQSIHIHARIASAGKARVLLS